MVVTKGTRKQGNGIGGMSHRTAAWLAWSLWAVCVVLIGLALLLDFLTSEVIPAGLPGQRPGPGFALLTGLLSLAYPTVGALIASRLPTNPIGWIFCGMGVFLILLFPDGRLPSRWWRLVAWAALLGVALAVLGFGFMPDKLIVTHPYVENPFGVIGVIGGGLTTYELFGASRFLGVMLLLTSSLAALLSLILRLHHTRGIERQRITWFLFAAVPLTVFLGLIELDLLILNLAYDFYLRFDFLFNNGTSIFPS